MTHNGEYPDELTLNELELKILTEVNFRKRLEHFQQHCDPYRNWKLENLNRDFFPLRLHFQVELSTSDQRQIQERLKLFFWNERYRFKLSRASLDGFGQPGTQFVLDPLKDAYFKPLTFWIKLFFLRFLYALILLYFEKNTQYNASGYNFERVVSCYGIWRDSIKIVPRDTLNCSVREALIKMSDKQTLW